MTCCFVYNAWVIPLRQFFSQYQTQSNLGLWLGLDYTADLFYLLDIGLVKYRLIFMDDGFWVKVSDPTDCCNNSLVHTP